MALRTRSFTLRRGDSLDPISTSINALVGMDSYLIKDVTVVRINETVNQLTVIYQDTPDLIVDSFSPRIGSILNTGVMTNNFDVRLLFNVPIDRNTIQSGTFLIDGQGLDTPYVFIDDSNYFVKLSLSNTGYHSIDFHELRMDSSKIKRQNNVQFEYTPVGGYVVASSPSFHLGDELLPYPSRRRGRIAIDSIRTTDKNVTQAIQEFFVSKALDKERLLKYAISFGPSGNVDIYLIYLKSLEPQIVSGFPLTNSYIPDTAVNDTLTLVFSTKLDPNYLLNTTGLFTIESDFATSQNISPSDISIESDLRTVKINLLSYLDSEKIYSVISQPGLRAYDGTVKQKPEQWVLHILALPAGATFTGDIDVGAINVQLSHSLLQNLGNDDHSQYHTNGRADSWILTNLSFTGHTGNLSNPHQVTATQVGAVPTATFTTHTGDSTIHYTQSQIDHTVLQNIGSNTHSQIDSHIASTSNPHSTTASQVGAPTVAQFTGHTGDSTIHYTQASISIPSTQVSDFTEAVLDVVGNSVAFSNGITGTYNDAGNVFTFSGTNATTISAGVASFNSSQFSVINGSVLITGQFTGFTGYISSSTYTDEQAQDAVGTILDTSANVSLLYNDSTPSIVADLVDTTITPGAYGDGRNIPVFEVDQKGRLIDATTIVVDAPTNASFTGHTGQSNIHYTQAQIDHTAIQNIGTNTHTQIDSHIASTSNPHSVTAAQVGAPALAVFTGHTGDSTIHFTQAQISIPSSQISDFTNAVQDSAASIFQFSNGITGTYNTSTNTFSLSGLFATTTTPGVSFFEPDQFTVVNGLVTFTGVAAGGTYTDTDARDAVGSILVDTSSINFSYVSDTSITADVLPAGVDHNSLANYVANEHTNHSSIFISGNDGLSGGGNLTASFNLGLSPTAVTPGTYGSASEAITITVDQKGRITDAVEQNISISTSQITDISSYATASSVTSLTSSFTGHTGTSSIHFTQAQIDHTQIQNIGTNSHSAIDSHIASNSNPHSVTASQVGAPTTALFTGHTGDATIHFTVGSISHTAIQNIGTNTHAQIDTHIANTSNPHSVTAAQVGAPTTAQFTGHTGDSSIHFTQAGISITASQVSDFTEAAQDAVGNSNFFTFSNGVTGNYSDGGNSFAISGTNATASAKGVASFNSTYFTVTAGAVTFNTGSLTDVLALRELSDVSNTTPVAGQSILYNGTHYNNYYAFTGISVTGSPFLSGGVTFTGNGTISVSVVGSTITFSGATGAGGGLVDADYGDFTIAGGVATIDNDTIDNNKLANMTSRTLKGNPNGTTADPEDISADNVISQILTGVMLMDGTRSFTDNVNSPLSLPTDITHLTNKFYVDQQDGVLLSAMTATAATLQPLDSTLTTIAATDPTGSALTGKLILFTGANLATTTNLTTQGKNMIAAPTVLDLSYQIPIWNFTGKVTETSNATTTFTNDTELIMDLTGTSTRYVFKGVVFYRAGAVGDAKFQMSGNYTYGGYTMSHYATAANATAFAGVGTDANHLTSTAVAANAGTGAYYINGTIYNAANTGRFVFAFAENAADGSNPTSLLSGSYLMWKKI